MKTKKPSRHLSKQRIPSASTAQLKALQSVLDVLPPDAQASDAELKTSLERYGQLSPIVYQRGQVVDGRRRLRLLSQLNKAPWIVHIDRSPEPTTPAEDGLGRAFFELNGRRRELNDAVKAAIADVLATYKKGDNQHTAGAAGMSREAAARLVRTSADSVDRWRFIKGHDVARNNALNGTWSLSHATRVVEGEMAAKHAASKVDKGLDAKKMLEQMVREKVRFGVFYADPPWDYELGDRAPTSAADPRRHYTTMTLDAIKALPVEKVAAKGSFCFLWCPNSYRARAEDVLRAWGFEPYSDIIWAKPSAPPTKGIVRPYHETLLVGIRGVGAPRTNAAIPSWYSAPQPNRKHSKKPIWFAQQIERLFPQKSVAKLELFCRYPRPGWHCLGNQVLDDGTNKVVDIRKGRKNIKNEVTRSAKVKKKTSALRRAA